MATSTITPAGIGWYTMMNSGLEQDGSTHYYDTVGMRDLSKATLLCFTPFADGSWRNSTVIPYSFFASSKVSLVWIRTNNQIYWIDVTRQSDTRFSVLASTNIPSDTRLFVTALVTSGTY